MTTYNVCHKWVLEVDDDAMDIAEETHNPPYIWTMQQPVHQLGQEAWAIEQLALFARDSMGLDIISVAEHMGGIGLCATILRSLYDVEYHATNDLAPSCYKQLISTSMFDTVTNTDWEMSARNEDFDCDLVTVDFTRFTLLTLVQNEGLAESFRIIFARRPECVIITDSAIGRLHLNKSIYTKHAPIDVFDDLSYALAMSMMMQKRYGYSIRYCTRHHVASFFLLTESRKPWKLTDQDMVVAPKDAKDCFVRA